LLPCYHFQQLQLIDMVENAEALNSEQSEQSQAELQQLQVDPNPNDPLQTLASGQRREVRGGSLQAHACAITHLKDIARVLEAFLSASAFQGVVSWSYAYRLVQITEDPRGEAHPAQGMLLEGVEDGLDDGCGEKILSVLRRASLQGMLLIVSRWQDHGRSPGLEVYGLEIYALVVERCKELIAGIKLAMRAEVPAINGFSLQETRSKNFDFSFLPPLPEPRVATKFGPNHFLYDTPMNKPRSLRSLLGGGDVNMWMTNDESLRHLEESELWALRSLRQPDARIEKVLHAVALLRGQSPPVLSGDPAARWGSLLQVLRSPTLRTELLLFDARSVPLDTARGVLATLESMQANDVRRANPGAAALYEWALGIARLRCAGSMEEAADSVVPLKPREADLPLPKLGASASVRKGLANGSRRCKMAGFDRSRSAALLGMTLF